MQRATESLEEAAETEGTPFGRRKQKKDKFWKMQDAFNAGIPTAQHFGSPATKVHDTDDVHETEVHGTDDAHETECSNSAMKVCLRHTFLDTFGEESEDVRSPRALSDPGSEVSSGYSAHFAKEKVYVEALSTKVSKTWSAKARKVFNGGTRSSNSGGCLSDEHSHGRAGGCSESADDSASRRISLPAEGSQGTLNSAGAEKQRGARLNLGKVQPSSNSSDVSFKTLHSYFGSEVGGRKPSLSGDVSRFHPQSYPQHPQQGSPAPVRHAVASDDKSIWDSRLPRSFTERPIESTAKSERKEMKQMTAAELRNLVHRKTVEINDVLNSERLSTALASINEIPEQVGEVLQESTRTMLDEVQGEVSVARDLLVNSEQMQVSSDGHSATAEKAAQSITMIPEMIMATFENSFAKAMTTVRIRVDDVIQGLESSDDVEKEQVVKQMWAIPDEVRQITRDAVQEASQDSRDIVVEQLDCVMQSFSEDKIPDAVWQAKQQIVAKVPEKLPDTATLQAATDAAETNVCQAVKVVQEQEKSEMTRVVANRVVADTLMRAKVGPSAQTEAMDRPGLQSLRVCNASEDINQDRHHIKQPEFNNPGTIGHPELCSRPCLYFVAGTCSNGDTCGFCHAPHSKRATHLDKRHREMVKTMTFSQRFVLIHGILQMKFEKLNVAREAIHVLAQLDALICKPHEADPEAKQRTKQFRTLQVALKSQSVRSLLMLLEHAPMPEDPSLCEMVQLLLQSVRVDTKRRNSSVKHTESPRSVQSHRSSQWTL